MECEYVPQCAPEDECPGPLLKKERGEKKWVGCGGGCFDANGCMIDLSPPCLDVCPGHVGWAPAINDWLAITVIKAKV